MMEKTDVRFNNGGGDNDRVTFISGNQKYTDQDNKGKEKVEQFSFKITKNFIAWQDPLLKILQNINFSFLIHIMTDLVWVMNQLISNVQIGLILESKHDN